MKRSFDATSDRGAHARVELRRPARALEPASVAPARRAREEAPSEASLVPARASSTADSGADVSAGAPFYGALAGV